MKTNPRSLALALLALSPLAACGGPTLDATSAAKALSAASGVTTQAQTKLGPQLQVAHGDWVSGTSSSFTVSGTLANEHGGGSATLTGSGKTTATGSAVDFELVFNGWQDTATNIKLDGSLKADIAVDTGKPPTSVVHELGDLTASGAVNGVVTFDLTAKSGPGGASVCGSIGGQIVKSGGC